MTNRDLKRPPTSGPAVSIRPSVEGSVASRDRAASSPTVRSQSSLENQKLNRVIGYIRVSTERQEEEGNSLQDQEEQIRVFVGEHSLTLHAVYKEAGSGMGSNLEKRPGLQQAILTAKDTGHPIVCTSIDRLGRNRDLLVREVLDAGIPVIATSVGKRLTDPELKKAVSDAQREGKRISKDTRAALGGLKNHSSPGASAGGRTRGMQITDQAQDHAEEIMPIIKEIEKIKGRRLSHAEIARELTKIGDRARTPGSRSGMSNGIWHARQVQRIRSRTCWVFIDLEEVPGGI